MSLKKEETNIIPASRRPVRRAIIKVVLGSLTRILFWYRGEGVAEPLSAEGQIIIANHASWFDPMFILAIYRSPRLHIVAKKELFANPVTRSVLQSFDCVPLDRTISDLKAARMILEQIKSRNVLGIFIEGTTVHAADAVKYPPKAAVVSLAVRRNIPLQLVTISGKIHLFSRPKIIFGPVLRLNLREGKKMTAEVSDRVAREIMRQIYAQGGMEYYNPQAKADRQCFLECINVENLRGKTGMTADAD